MRNTVIPTILKTADMLKSYNKKRVETYKNLGDGVPTELAEALHILDMERAILHGIAIQAQKRSIEQDTTVGGSPTRRRRADGSITP